MCKRPYLWWLIDVPEGLDASDIRALGASKSGGITGGAEEGSDRRAYRPREWPRAATGPVAPRPLLKAAMRTTGAEQSA